MSEPSIFFSEVNERQGVFTRRAFLMGGLTGLGLVALGGQLVHLQLVEANRYAKLAESNKFNFRLVPPPRGLILDRNGVTLASNRPNFRLLVARDGGMDVETTVAELSNLVPIDDKRRIRLVKDIKRAPKRSPVSVMEDMTWEEFSRVNVRAPELPGVTADMGEVRVYPHGGAFAHVIGYVAKVNDKDVKAAGANPDPLLYNPGFRIGRQGIEKAFDLQLRGKPGAQKQEVDAKGRVVRQDPRGDIAPTPGKEIRLTIDVDVQERALEVFGEQSGAAVVMDCRTGDLLCLLSAPSFDANRFVRGLTVPEYKALNEYERRPLLDKALSGTYPPGSTFKTMVALAALESGMITPQDRYVCGGAWWFGGRYFHCWKKDGHGAQNMHDAIKNSCDIYFYQVALKIGPDRIASVAGPFGIGQTFDIGITGQMAGTLPSTDWVKKHRPSDPKWYPGESPSYGIGQGLLNVNPLQLCVMTARLANGRKALNPRLVKSIGGVEQPRGSEAPDLPFSPEHIAIVREGMAAVANDVSGGAYRQSQLGLGPIKMAGKTGTAQVRSYDKVASRKSSSVGWKLKDHNWFVAFAPYDNPRYALSLLVEHGGGSGATEAAPRAREIMRTVLLKDPELRSLIEQPMPMPDVDPGADTEGAAPDLPDAAPPPPPGAPT
ncbi:penicillin-binding protein 2 [Caulobacter ginsengisoli]|uniref:Penicillin-binding protein 2 n=1 Tax=Caulobacter ginsengisoli TaxID=400775 RepID=A0ABU0ILS0_9CAUL|nr:penicillin-binding protein 2 [Caulobacter ginsengisoli]MDQ0462316.1 penicillin-binding protein 2 [Caulobacter ginsengisoli]